jgi:hypothetical protein
LTIVDDSLVIRKAEKSRQERINEALEKIDEQYGDVLKKLSE